MHSKYSVYCYRYQHWPFILCLISVSKVSVSKVSVSKVSVKCGIGGTLIWSVLNTSVMADIGRNCAVAKCQRQTAWQKMTEQQAH